MNKRTNIITFGLGTIGRDMVYVLIGSFLIVFLTEVLDLNDKTMWWITTIIVAARIFDAVNDPIMGVIVDNTKSKWGKFKPWIASGALATGVFTILLFNNFGLKDNQYIIYFSVCYLLWGLSYTANDISYWSMLPALSIDQKHREKIGTFSRICANVGVALTVVSIFPITDLLTEKLGGRKEAFFVFAIALALIMILGQSITLFGVKEPRKVFKQEESTTLKGMFTAIIKNDQLLYTSIAMVLYMIGSVTTSTFGPYFFKYAYKNEHMYTVFAGILISTQILTLAVFPLFRKKYTRKQLYKLGIIFVFAGYVLFFFSPMNMIFIGISGVTLFIGQAFIQILMLMFLADTVEYGQWKLGKRNESVTFALQPFINKMGGALATGIVGATVIISGINDAKDMYDVTAGGLLIMKIAMFVIPLFFILSGYLVYRAKFKIDEKMHSKILADLKERGDINLDAEGK